MKQDLNYKNARAWIGALIGAGASIASSAISAHSTRKNIKETNEANSIQNKVNNMRSAGLNPNLLNGALPSDSVADTTSGQIGSAMASNIGSMVQNFIQEKQSSAEIEKTQAEANLIKAQTPTSGNLGDAQLQLNSKQQAQIDSQIKVNDEQMRLISSQVDNMVANTQLTQVQKDKVQQETLNLQQEYENLVQDLKNKKLTADEIKARIANIKKSTELLQKNYDLDVKRFNLEVDKTINTFNTIYDEIKTTDSGYNHTTQYGNQTDVGYSSNSSDNSGGSTTNSSHESEQRTKSKKKPSKKKVGKASAIPIEPLLDPDIIQQAWGSDVQYLENNEVGHDKGWHLNNRTHVDRSRNRNGNTKTTRRSKSLFQPTWQYHYKNYK